MQRYMLFGYDEFYPAGGLGDIIGSFDTAAEIEEAIEAQLYKLDQYEVLDLKLRKWLPITYTDGAVKWELHE